MFAIDQACSQDFEKGGPFKWEIWGLLRSDLLHFTSGKKVNLKYMEC